MAGTLYVENVKLGRKITLDELFDLALFKKLHELESGEVQVVLSRLIVIDKRMRMPNASGFYRKIGT